MTLELTLGLIGLATLIGVAFKVFQGRGHAVMGNERVDLVRLRGLHQGKSASSFGSKASAILFSTQYCSICPSVSRQLSGIESKDSSLQLIEVDITDRLDLAAHFSVTQTPTVLITDAAGRIRFRISGAPKPGVIARELATLGVKIN